MRNPSTEHLSPAYPQRAAWGTASRLRAWQAEALERYLAHPGPDFLAVATPGAGKTTFALRVAAELLAARTVERVVVVTPTEHLKTQWADAATRVGIHIDPGLPGRQGRSREYHGQAVTYAGVAAGVFAWQTRVVHARTLVILDEVHHAGDALSWGEAIRDAFEHATRRLALTGTPFRSDSTPIPFVRYTEEPDGSKRSAANYTYGYAEALRDQVVRPVLFMAYGGDMRWRTRAGDELAADLAEPLTKDVTAQAWRTALAPQGEWIPAVLAAANTRLHEVRRHIPDAGGLVIATNQNQARAYARRLADLTGSRPVLVLSDDVGAGRRIEEFASGSDAWLVAVRMVSEGVDVPRLAVGVYATATATPLYFAQAVGRFVRARRRGETATVFLPTVPILLAHASVMERQRDHVLGRPRAADDLWAPEEELLAEARRTRTHEDVDGSFEPLSSQARFDHVLFDAQAYGLHAAPTSRDEADYLGLPGLLEPEQVTSLLRERQRRQVARAARREAARRDGPGTAEPPQALHRVLADGRKELNSLVAQVARVHGVPHSHVHADLRRQAGGPPLAQATSAQVAERITLVRRWLAEGR